MHKYTNLTIIFRCYNIGIGQLMILWLRAASGIMRGAHSTQPTAAQGY